MVQNRKNRFTSSSISFQIVAFALTFILGWFGEKIATKIWFVASHSIIPAGAATPIGFDITKGWNELCVVEGVWPMVFVGEIIIFGVILTVLVLITRKARRNEELREDARDKKLDELPERIANQLAPMISRAISEGIVAGMKAIRAEERKNTE